MKHDWFKGVVVPLVTPLTASEELDEPAMRKIVQRQLDAGVDVLFVLGSAGEGPMLDSKTQRRVVTVVTEAVEGRVPVLAGVTDNSVALVLNRLEDLAEMGVKAGVCTLPYYGWYESPAAEIEFFATLAEKSPVPLIPYNLPRVVKVSIKPETIRDLYGHPNIAGLKDTNTDLTAMEGIAGDPARPPDFRYLPGNSSLAFQLLQAGADGFVTAPANVMPEIAVGIYRHYRQGRSHLAKSLGECLAKLNETGKCPTTPGGLKVALELQGVCSRRTVRPWPQADSEDERKVRGILTAVQEMYAPLASV